LLALRPALKLGDHPLSAVCDCLIIIFAATLHIGGRFSIRNLRTRHAVVTGRTYTTTTKILNRNFSRRTLQCGLRNNVKHFNCNRYIYILCVVMEL